MKPTLALLALTILLIGVPAQAGTWSPYGATCNGGAALAVQGVPRIGTTVTVTGVAFPAACTRKFCGCNVGKCNDCYGSVLCLGVHKIHAPLPGGCPLLNSADLLLAGQGVQGTVTLPIPNNPALFNLQFHMQRFDLRLDEYITASCSTVYQPVSFSSSSGGVTGTIGL